MHILSIIVGGAILLFLLILAVIHRHFIWDTIVEIFCPIHVFLVFIIAMCIFSVIVGVAIFCITNFFDWAHHLISL